MRTPALFIITSFVLLAGFVVANAEPAGGALTLYDQQLTDTSTAIAFTVHGQTVGSIDALGTLHVQRLEVAGETVAMASEVKDTPFTWALMGTVVGTLLTVLALELVRSLRARAWAARQPSGPKEGPHRTPGPPPSSPPAAVRLRPAPTTIPSSGRER